MAQMNPLRATATLACVLVLCLDARAAKPSDCDDPKHCQDNRLAADVIDLVRDPAERDFVRRRHGQDDASGLAAAEMLWQRVNASRGASAELRAAAAEPLIDAYLSKGLSKEAIGVFDSLDEATRKQVIAGPDVQGYAETRPEPNWQTRFSLQLDPLGTASGLVGAYATSARMADADRLIAFAADANAARLGDHGLRWTSCVRTLIHPKAHTDWFGWLYGDESAGSAAGGGCHGVVVGRDMARLEVQRIASSGLPEEWHGALLPNIRPDVIDSGQEALDALLRKLPATRDRIAELNSRLAEVDSLDARWISTKDELPPPDPAAIAKQPPPSDANRALVRTLAERLARPIHNPYRVAAADARERASTAKKAPTCAQGVLKCVVVGGVRWELYESKDYDPSGEVPAAGFWLRRSALGDGSSRSYYLGIKEHSPFELVTSNTPLVRDGELHLLVRRAAIDPRQISFPPVGLQMQHGKQMYDLSARLDDILRDSDGDGLTDLAEQQLLLDPHNTDSDGDGVPDGEDALPDVASVSHPTQRQMAFATALAFATRQSDLAISVLVPGTKVFEQRRLTDEATLFVIADPADMGAILTRHRIVVLPLSLDQKLLASHPGFGVFYPMRISLRLLGDGTYAEVVYSFGWTGGTLALHWDGNSWHIGSRGKWVT